MMTSKEGSIPRHAEPAGSPRDTDRSPVASPPGRLAGRPFTDGMLTRRTSLNLPPQIPLDEWSRIGHEIFVISESSTWWLGDWLIYGQAQYPDRYMHAIAKTSLDYQTLRNYAWVARRYSVTRRRPALSFQHHAELASLPEEQQENWLDRAEKFSWSRNELRNRVRASRKAARAADDEGGSDVLSIEMNVPADRKQRWLEAASTTKQDLLSWIVSILDNAADTVIGLPGDDHAISGKKEG
ncbi:MULTISPECIES: LmbU family transcriptional regulator [unclassified Amycolatopsis]|uniref:LmbU family transcriptional regulator n=2 Tax=unclassified Amycolatopsis TaxID=2618356 RepID=UPI002E161BEE|nr:MULTISPECIES: LmbU family transcriptional regulator [unclassified Amycolatopsis]WSK82945.1 LmbU family transcriptional regulator [Amycolatopsis sp. NBC_01286]